MGVDCQALREEELVTGTHHTTIVQVYIIDKQPSADAVGLKCTIFFKQLHVVFIEFSLDNLQMEIICCKGSKNPLHDKNNEFFSIRLLSFSLLIVISTNSSTNIIINFLQNEMPSLFIDILMN